MAQAQYAGTGRRKNAVARVRLVPGTGKITVNKNRTIYRRNHEQNNIYG